VGHAHGLRRGVQVAVHDNVACKRRGAGIGHDEDLAVGQDPRERDDAAASGGMAEVGAVAGHLAEVQAAIGESRLASAQ